MDVTLIYFFFVLTKSSYDGWKHEIIQTQGPKSKILTAFPFFCFVWAIPNSFISCKTLPDIFSLWLMYRNPLFKTLTQGGDDVLLCLVQVQYGVCPQIRVPCTRHGKQLIIAVSWGYLVRGDTGKCSCSHRVCERSTHAQRADKRVRKGTEKFQGYLSCQDQQNWGGLV